MVTTTTLARRPSSRGTTGAGLGQRGVTLWCIGGTVVRMWRRQFMTGTGLVGVGAVAGLAGCEPASRPARRDLEIPATAPSPRPGDWAAARAQFDLDPELSHFSAFVLAPHPAPVRAAIERHRRGMDRDAVGYLHANERRLEAEVRAAAAAYLGAARDEIALTDSTTMGLGLLYGGIRLRPDQEILSTEHDFYATGEALRLRAERTGAAVRRVALYREIGSVTAGEILGSVRAALRLPRLRLPQVAVRPARHRLRVGQARGLGPGHRDHSQLRQPLHRRLDRRRHATDPARSGDDPWRLPLLRAPLGAGRGVPPPGNPRAPAGRRSRPRPGAPARRRPGHDAPRPAGHPGRRRPLGGHRLLRRRRPASRQNGRAPAAAARRGQRHALRPGARPPRYQHRHRPRRRRAGAARRPLPRLT